MDYFLTHRFPRTFSSYSFCIWLQVVTHNVAKCTHLSLCFAFHNMRHSRTKATGGYSRQLSRVLLSCKFFLGISHSRYILPLYSCSLTMKEFDEHCVFRGAIYEGWTLTTKLTGGTGAEPMFMFAACTRRGVRRRQARIRIVLKT